MNDLLRLDIDGFADPELGERWRAETERSEFDERDWDATECAQLADELAYLGDAVLDDERFDDTYAEWHDFVLEKEIWLPLEQSCHEGVLLPTEQRAVRLASCPEQLLRPLRWFFELCPEHVKAYIAMDFSVVVRSERARRTGSPEWRPRTGHAADPEGRTWLKQYVPRRYTG